jgi:hypothetical protein
MTRRDKANDAWRRMMLAADDLMGAQCVNREHRDRVTRAMDKVEEALEEKGGPTS